MGTGNSEGRAGPQREMASSGIDVLRPDSLDVGHSLAGNILFLEWS